MDQLICLDKQAKMYLNTENDNADTFYIYFYLFNVHVSLMQGDIKIENRNQLCILVLSERRHCESEQSFIF